MDAQVDLSLRWEHSFEGTFSHVTAHVHISDYDSCTFRLKTE